MDVLGKNYFPQLPPRHTLLPDPICEAEPWVSASQQLRVLSYLTPCTSSSTLRAMPSTDQNTPRMTSDVGQFHSLSYMLPHLCPASSHPAADKEACSERLTQPRLHICFVVPLKEKGQRTLRHNIVFTCSGTENLEQFFKALSPPYSQKPDLISAKSCLIPLAPGEHAND